MNISTIIVCIIVSLIVILAVAKIVRDKKSGRGSCSCGCSSCPGQTFCDQGKQGSGKE